VAGTLHIREAVITEACLRARHGDESEIAVGDGAVITPSGWDYIRDHRLRVVRGAADQACGATPSAPAPAASGSGSAATPGQIREVQPPAADGTSIRAPGRFEHPEQSYGCKTDEFGSGYAAADGTAGAVGDAEFEAMVQRITDLIMERLESS